ncbi:Panacea domain-containing protein [Metabacillus idriensis]|uniref:Panacea domain-containing protein n=1 Tax=Metabacillus idriensis TaxID=324768 RepID=UPI00174E563C|nr:type II toxin-antitoxin system antitoxin SocA domain-containing protein [Metabacillus idriensis]
MDVRRIALYFLWKSQLGGNYYITHLKLQKLVYYAQAWSLALRGRRLFRNELEAWLHGPVSRDLYREYRDYGSNIIEPVLELNFRFDRDDIEILEGVWELYGSYDGKYLETLTHKEDPWIIAWKKGMNSYIDVNDMKNYYGEKMLQGAN